MPTRGAEPVERELTERVIGAAIEVHRHLGPGLLESAYGQCLCHELSRRGLVFTRQTSVPVIYKGLRLECGYRSSLVMEERVVLELKAVAELTELHRARLLTYLRPTGKPVGLVINFNVPVLEDGIMRVVV